MRILRPDAATAGRYLQAGRSTRVPPFAQSRDISPTTKNAPLLHNNPVLHRPWNVSGWDRRMTFEGVLLHGSSREDGTIGSYTHFYRNGILEAVTTSLLETQQVSGQRLIPHSSWSSPVL